MRLVTFEVDTPAGVQRRVGGLVEESIVDIAVARSAQLDAEGRPRSSRRGESEIPTGMLEFLRAGERALEIARGALEYAQRDGVEVFGADRARYAAADARLIPPLPRPNSIRAFSLIEEHLLNAIASISAGSLPGVKEMALPKLPDEWYEIPAHYKGNADEIYGPDETVPWPAYTKKLDFELEIAAVIGRTGRRIAVEDAGAYIAGYTIFNDWSARDLQQTEMRVNLGPGICKDFANGLGPCIATPDEFDRDRARLEVRVDGETWSTSRLEMHFSFEDVIAYVTQEQTLHPGDLLSSGTVARGAGVELNRWITEGATVELEAEGIGVLRNVVGYSGQATELPASQRPSAGGVSGVH